MSVMSLIKGEGVTLNCNCVIINYADECIFAGLHRCCLLDVPHGVYVTKSKLIEDFLFASNTF